MKTPAPSPEDIARALALKRHEQPPRPFFKNLSSAVIDRLQHPEPPPPPTLLQRLGLDFDRKAVLVCLSAVVVCALLAFGWIQSRNVKPPAPQAGSPGASGSSLMENPSLRPAAPAATVPPGTTPASVTPAMANTEGDRMNVRPAPAPAPRRPGN